MNNPAFLFDLDGVLIDTHDLHWESWKSMKKELPFLSSLSRERFKREFGKSNDTFLKIFAPTSTKEERKIWGERKEALFREIAAGKIAFLPGIESFLQSIKKAKIPLIIASSSPISNMEFYIHKTSIGKYFSQYVSAEHVEKGKPAPDIFLEAASRLKTPAESCIILEDSLAGLKAARLAGGRVIAIATTYTVEDLKANSDADLILHPHELELNFVLQHFLT